MDGGRRGGYGPPIFEEMKKVQTPETHLTSLFPIYTLFWNYKEQINSPLKLKNRILFWPLGTTPISHCPDGEGPVESRITFQYLVLEQGGERRRPRPERHPGVHVVHRGRRKLSAILCDFHMKWVAQLKLKSQREFRFPLTNNFCLYDVLYCIVSYKRTRRIYILADNFDLLVEKFFLSI